MGDLYDELQGLADEIEAAGLPAAAAAIRRRCLEPAFTTSSEWLGEIGGALAELLATERDLPAATRRRLLKVLDEVGRVWPNYRLLALRQRIVGWWRR